MGDDLYRLPSPEHHLDDDPFEAQPLSPEQQRHVDLMRHITQEVTARTGDNFVLKGGTALLLSYGLPRFSTDLDFDGRRTSVDLSPLCVQAPRLLECQCITSVPLRIPGRYAVTWCTTATMP